MKKNVEGRQVYLERYREACQNRKVRIFLRIFDEILSGFRDKFQKRVTCVAFSIKFAITNQKIADLSEFFNFVENYSILFNIIRVLR